MADVERTVVRADEVREGYSARLPDSQEFQRIEDVSSDSIGRVILTTTSGPRSLRPDELVDIEAVTGLSVPPYLRSVISDDRRGD